MWTTDIPTEPGKYWFYGDAIAGQMGVDFTDRYKCEGKLHLVEVWETSNSLVGITNGHFMVLRKFDRSKRSEGHIGYWMPCVTPELPVDSEGYFATRESVA